MHEQQALLHGKSLHAWHAPTCVHMLQPSAPYAKEPCTLHIPKSAAWRHTKGGFDKEKHMTLPGTTELLIILFLFMLLFGGRKLPGLARGLGESIRELRKAAADDEPEQHAGDTETRQAASSERRASEYGTPGAPPASGSL